MPSEDVLVTKFIVEVLVLFQTIITSTSLLSIVATNGHQFRKLDMQAFLGMIYSTLYVKYSQGGRERDR
jgi:hypothetical protein